MNSNRDLLKEAIADAKAVKETAIANAKAALEESFGPFLREKLAMKLSEMDEMDEVEKEVEEGYGEEMEESYEMDEAETNEMDEAKEEMDEELDLEALLRELDGMEEGEEGINEAEDLLNDPKGPTAHGNVAEEEEMGEEEEEINIEDMSADDLKDFIESVIADMVEAGELEAGEEMESEEEGEEEMMDEVDLEELMAEVKKAKISKAKEKAKEEEKDKKVKEVEKKLEEAYNTIKTMQSTLNEVNLLNAKLLYTNKIFKSKSLTESQKVKVLTAFDKATSKKEAQLVYETLLEGLKEKKTQVNESMLGGASKVIGGPAPKQPIIEVNNQFARWQKLAGINK